MWKKGKLLEGQKCHVVSRTIRLMKDTFQGPQLQGEIGDISKDWKYCVRK